MFGTNGPKIAFANIKATSLMPEPFLAKKINNKKVPKGKNDPDASSGDTSTIESESFEFEEKNDSKNDSESKSIKSESKEDQIEYKCTTLVTKRTRLNWCSIEYPKLVIFKNNINNCVMNFCDICCGIYSKKILKCKENCN